MNTEEHYLKRELYELIKQDATVFEFLQLGSLDGIWYWDLETQQDEWMSSRFWTLLGYDSAKMKHLASEWQNIIFPEDLEVATDNFSKHCADPHHPYDQVVRYHHKDGSTVWVRCRGIAIRDETGKPIRMLGAHTDLTEFKRTEEALRQRTIQLEAANKKLKRAEEALRRSEAHLEEAQRIAHVGSWDWIAATDTPTWSKELCRILEVDPDKPVPSMAEQDKLYTPDSMVRMRTSVGKTMRTGEPYEIELERVREDGSRRWLLARGEQWQDEQGGLIGLRGTALDITERKRSEQALAAERQRFLNMLDTLPVMVEIVRPDHRIEWANRAYRLTLGDNIGRICYESHFDRNEPCTECQSFIPLTTGQPHHWEWTLPNGRTYDIHTFPFVAADGSAAILEVDIDLTERKQVEESLKQANETLEQRVAERTAELEQRAEQLQQLALDLTSAEDRERRHLAAILHDDFQQDAACIKMELDRLSVRADTDMHHRLTNLAQFTGECIEKMRHLSYTLNPPALHRSGLLAALNVLSKDMQTHHGLAVTLRTQAGAEPVSSTLSSMLYRSVRELLFNVIKHAGVNAAVVDVDGRDKWIRIKVTDHGKGFDYPAIRAGQGSEAGFGLYNIEDRMSFLGGSMHIESRPGKGSCIVLKAPKEISPNSAALEERSRTTVIEQSTAPEPARRSAMPDDKDKIRILLVEDHKLFRKGLAELLQDHKELVVVGEAEDGEMAIELAAQLMPNVILMDVTMPKLDGVEATARITRNHPDIRIIGLSMHNDDDTRKKMLNVGAEAFLAKTISPDKLVETIRRVHRGLRRAKCETGRKV